MQPRIAPFADHPELAESVARWHFDEWGALSPDATLEAWTAHIQQSASRASLPITYIALDASAGDDLLGSVTLVECDMETRPDLTPWLAGLFVRPASRSLGVGSLLALHAVSAAAAMGVARLYLYTHAARSFYERLGWHALEPAFYEGRDVTIMAIEPAAR